MKSPFCRSSCEVSIYYYHHPFSPLSVCRSLCEDPPDAEWQAAEEEEDDNQEEHPQPLLQ